MRWRVVGDSPTPPTVKLLIVGLFIFFQSISCTHAFTHSFIHSLDNIDADVDESLAPYSEDLDVESYKEYLCKEDIQQVASYYDLSSNELVALSKKLPDWSGCEGGVDANGLFEIRTENPDGMWDWYVIGGRWDGYIHGERASHNPYDEDRAIKNTLPVKHLLDLDDASLQLRLPAVILTPDGGWMDQYDFFSSLNGEEEMTSDRLASLRRSLDDYPDHHVVCVDIHR